jgi:hypothetical protein
VNLLEREAELPQRDHLLPERHSARRYGTQDQILIWVTFFDQ